ncbi:MAG: helix-turn-helix domain-containing protein [Hamadaea sp.]|uniref:helix-turn-helix domain-containing protein n=1 Tax=Hamadaea sp. TaxID=2024425 RepID=UPI0017DA7911|nr:helix-turn-helix transcriptional regulator [Hamadaea sp.]NUR73359.1 helix-turn-helix domain-containing protein [Hamadaea sp.]NUT21273.1 helix-turn-helix domain-containing protein [Hamadaea sp.]
MAVQGSPAVARHRLRLALRKAREAKELTQGEVAASLDWSLSKLQRIEGGENSVSPTDTRALLQVLGVTDPATVDGLVNESRLARKRSSWDEARYRETLSDATRSLVQFEAEATVIRAFQTILPPGSLQTRAFAEHVLSFWNHEFSQAELDLRIEVRAERRRRLFDRPNRPDYRLLLDESVLHRPIGGPEVFAGQLEQLLSDSAAGLIDLRIASFETTALFIIGMPFTVLTLDDVSGSFLYRESYLVDEFVHELEKVNRHLSIFDQLWQKSHDRQETQRLIATRIDRLRTRPDGAQPPNRS